MRSRTRTNARSGFTKPELAIAVALVVVLAAVLVPAVRRSIEVKGKMTCANNLKQIGVALRMYATATPGEKYPPMRCIIRDTGVTLVSAPDMSLLYPDYLADPSVMICPRDDVRVKDLQDKDGAWCFSTPESEGGCAERTGASYVYWGWLMDRVKLADPGLVESFDTNEDGAGVIHARYRPDAGETRHELFLDAVITKLESAAQSNTLHTILDSELDIGFEDAEYSHQPWLVYRIREGIAGYTGIRDVNGPCTWCSDLDQYTWVFYEALNPPSRRFLHQPHGGHVLYMDGHVEFVELEDKPPMVSAMGPYLNGIVRHIKYPAEPERAAP